MNVTPAMRRHLLRMARIYIKEAKFGDPRHFDPQTVEFCEALVKASGDD